MYIRYPVLREEFSRRRSNHLRVQAKTELVVQMKRRAHTAMSEEVIGLRSARAGIRVGEMITPADKSSRRGAAVLGAEGRILEC
jgi:hypothetical protein